MTEIETLFIDEDIIGILIYFDFWSLKGGLDLSSDSPDHERKVIN